MDRLTTTDRTERFYKNWGSGQPIVFKRDRPLSDEDWTATCCSSCEAGVASWPATAAGTDGQARPGLVMA